MNLKPIIFGAIAIALAISTSAAFAQQALGRYDIRIINNSSSTIMEVYARNLVTDRVYGDLLGSGVIGVGEFHRIRLDDSSGACNWRIQVKTLDGRDLRKNLNICNTTSLTVHD